METRHNTQALERVLELSMQRHAGLAVVAHAEALRQIGRYKWQRLLAWASAVAIVAVGIGLGTYLFNSRHTTMTVQNIPAPPVVAPAPPKSETPPKVEAPAPPKVEPAAQKPAIVTTDFTIFKKKSIEMAGRSWIITAGHAFATQEDQVRGTWQSAWCYTEASRDKLVVNFDLGSRSNNAAVQSNPSFDQSFAQSLGLSNVDILKMAVECPWLDGKSFGVSVPPFGAAAPPNIPVVAQQPVPSNPLAIQDGDSEIVQSDLPGANSQPIPASAPAENVAGQAQKFLYWQDYDASGGDLPGMPIRDISFAQCELSCRAASACVLATYNQKHNACFLKSSLQGFQKFPGAITLSRPNLRQQLMSLANGN